MALSEKKDANGTDSQCQGISRENDEEQGDSDGEDDSSLNNEEESQPEGDPSQRQRIREDNSTDKFSQNADSEETDGDVSVEEEVSSQYKTTNDWIEELDSCYETTPDKQKDWHIPTLFSPQRRRPYLNPVKVREEQRTFDPVSLGIRRYNLRREQWLKDFEAWWRENPRPDPLLNGVSHYHQRKGNQLFSIVFIGYGGRHELPRNHQMKKEEDLVLNDFKSCWISCPTREWKKRQALKKNRERGKNLPQIVSLIARRFRKINCWRST